MQIFELTVIQYVKYIVKISHNELKMRGKNQLEKLVISFRIWLYCTCFDAYVYIFKP